MTKRNLFAELKEGFDALAEARAGKVTLRKQTVDYQPPVEMSAADQAECVPTGVCSLLQDLGEGHR